MSLRVFEGFLDKSHCLGGYSRVDQREGFDVCVRDEKVAEVLGDDEFIVSSGLVGIGVCFLWVEGLVVFVDVDVDDFAEFHFVLLILRLHQLSSLQHVINLLCFDDVAIVIDKLCRHVYTQMIQILLFPQPDLQHSNRYLLMPEIIPAYIQPL